MRKNILKLLVLTLVGVAFMSVATPVNIYAEETGDSNGTETSETENSGTSISLTPVSKVLQISSDSSYEDHFTISNDGNGEMRVEVYAAPYSYVYSESEDTYKLGFSNENSFTQIARWITFRDSSGNYVAKPTFTIDPKDSLDVYYRITTPSNIPAGGQYAVIFAHTLTSAISSSGIRTEASPGIVVYGRSTEGEAIISAEISSLELNQIKSEGENVKNLINASAKVKNIGNVDFNASGVLKIEGILGGASYVTPADRGRISVIPDAELVVSDSWEETPGFGLFRVTWTVTAGEETQTIERIIFINPLPFIIISIILLTIIIVWVTIVVRKRKERRSRLAV